MFKSTELNQTWEEERQKTGDTERENRGIWALWGEQRKQAYQWKKPLSETEMENVMELQPLSVKGSGHKIHLP